MNATISLRVPLMNFYLTNFSSSGRYIDKDEVQTRAASSQMTHLSKIVAVDLNGQIGRMGSGWRVSSGENEPRFQDDENGYQTGPVQPAKPEESNFSLSLARSPPFSLLFNENDSLLFFGRTDEYIKTLFVTDDRLLLEL